MPTTTNYGWTTPADTDLVKDGAAAIRTLGSSIDTTTKALNPSTTLGDIEYRSSTANTNTRLAIGSSNQVLTVSGGVPAWVTPSGGGLTLLSTTTLSGSSTTISSISQSYKNLYVEVYGVTSSSAYLLRLAPNGLTNSTASVSLYDTGVTSYQNSYYYFTGGNSVTASQVSNYVMRFENYSSGTYRKVISHTGSAYMTSAGDNVGSLGAGTYNSTSAITSLVFSPSAGTFSAGTVLIYGEN